MIYFLGLILALLPIYNIRLQIAGIPTTVLEILIVVFLFLVLIKIKKPDLQKIRNLGTINYAIIGFLIAAIISTIISPEKLRALGQLKAFIVEPILLFYASILVIKSKEQLAIVLKFLLAGIIGVCLYGIQQYYTHLYLPLKFWGTGEEVKRIAAFFEHPNALALYLAPAFVFYFTLFIKKFDIKMPRWILLASLALMFIVLTMTFSRGAWLAVILVCGLMLLKEFGYKKSLPIMLILIGGLLLIPAVRDRVMLGFNDPSSLVHIELWKLGFERIVSHPVLGTGLHSFKAFTVEYPHNIFLNFWVEMGILGLISFAGVLILTWEKHRASRHTITLASGIFLMVVVLHGLVDMPYFKNDLSVLFWFAISLAFNPKINGSIS